MSNFGPPVGYTPTGDMTPFTQFTPQGDPVAFLTNSRGDVVPFELTQFAADGSPAPFAFDDQGNRTPGVNELFPTSQATPPPEAIIAAQQKAADHAVETARRAPGPAVPAFSTSVAQASRPTSRPVVQTYVYRAGSGREREAQLDLA